MIDLSNAVISFDIQLQFSLYSWRLLKTHLSSLSQSVLELTQANIASQPRIKQDRKLPTAELKSWVRKTFIVATKSEQVVFSI